MPYIQADFPKLGAVVCVYGSRIVDDFVTSGRLPKIQKFSLRLPPQHIYILTLTPF